MKQVKRLKFSLYLDQDISSVYIKTNWKSVIMKISKESKVGVLVAIAIAILAVGYNFMKGEDIFTNRFYF